MIEDPISVTIDGETLSIPVMPLYCLERAWPHIQRLGAMAGVNAVLAQARLDRARAQLGPEADRADGVLRAAEAAVVEQKADFLCQTHTALEVIVAALALSVPPPTYDDLAKRVRPDELGGIHMACNQLMDASGLIQRNAATGEALAASRVVPKALSNGIDSSLN